MILIPYELLEALFGKSFADYFDTLFMIAVIVGGVILIYKLTQGNKGANQNTNDWIETEESKHKTRFDYMNAPIIEASKARRAKEEKDRKEAERLERYRKNQEGKPTTYEEWVKENHPEYESIQGKWSPTGWYFNKETGKWEPPDYLNEESKRKWRWNDEKKVWVDIDKERRMERYRKNREGQPPTYEEWKAAKLAEQMNQTEE